jgi:hypothetical protein
LAASLRVMMMALMRIVLDYTPIYRLNRRLALRSSRNGSAR